MVFFWRGVWHTADYLSIRFLAKTGVITTTDLGNPWDGLLSFALGSVLLLVTRLLVSSFIGNEIIISGLRGERKLTEKTEAEVRTETGAIARIQEELTKLSKSVEELKKK